MCVFRCAMPHTAGVPEHCTLGWKPAPTAPGVIAAGRWTQFLSAVLTLCQTNARGLGQDRQCYRGFCCIWWQPRRYTAPANTNTAHTQKSERSGVSIIRKAHFFVQASDYNDAIARVTKRRASKPKRADESKNCDTIPEVQERGFTLFAAA